MNWTFLEEIKNDTISDSHQLDDNIHWNMSKYVKIHWNDGQGLPGDFPVKRAFNSYTSFFAPKLTLRKAGYFLDYFP